MNTNFHEVHSQPELSIVDGSGQDSVRFFNTFALEQPEVLQSVLLSDSVVLEASPDAIDEAVHQEAAHNFRDLLTHAHNGRLIDYDSDTWGALMQNQKYQDEVKTMRTLREQDPGLEDQRRRVAATGLGFYATRLLRFASRGADIADVA